MSIQRCMNFRAIVAHNRNGDIVAATEVRCQNASTTNEIHSDNATGVPFVVQVCEECCDETHVYNYFDEAESYGAYL